MSKVSVSKYTCMATYKHECMATSEAEVAEFQSILKDNRIRLVLCLGGLTKVKTGLPQTMPLFESQHELFVPKYWDNMKRLRFIKYVKQMYPIYQEECKARQEKEKYKQKMAWFHQRLEKETEREKMEAEYQAFKKASKHSKPKHSEPKHSAFKTPIVSEEILPTKSVRLEETLADEHISIDIIQ